MHGGVFGWAFFFLFFLTRVEKEHVYCHAAVSQTAPFLCSWYSFCVPTPLAAQETEVKSLSSDSGWQAVTVKSSRLAAKFFLLLRAAPLHGADRGGANDLAYCKCHQKSLAALELERSSSCLSLCWLTLATLSSLRKYRSGRSLSSV